MQQAETAGARIAALDRVKAIYASPMERTQETAAPIAKACKLRVRTHKGLIEADFGQWTGKKLSDLRKLPEWKTVQSYPCLLYTSPSPRDATLSRMPSSA